MASRIRVEERRRAVARRVLEIAAIATNHDNLLVLLATEYGKELEKLGGGAFREVYALPQGLVLKAQRGFSDCNESEHAAAQKRPDLVATSYGQYQHGETRDSFINILIQRRARIKPGAVWDSATSAYKSQRARELRDYVSDFHSTNVGFIRNRLMIVDAGNGLFV